MKKIISILMILNIVLLVFSVTDFQEVSAVNGCCVKDNKCTFSDGLQCTGGSFTPGSCSSVTACQAVCCITQDGKCYSDKSTTECKSLQGFSSTTSSKCDEDERCGKVCCILGGEVIFGITQSECNIKAQTLGITPSIHTEVSSESACRDLISNQEGCCITEGGCSRTYDSQCTGEFKGGKLCSAPELAGKCVCKKEDSKTCDGGNIIWKDSCGNLENVFGVPYDSKIHNKLSDIQNKQGYCDISQNKKCGKVTSNNYACVDLNCDVNDVFPLYENYDPETGIFENKNDITIITEMLGGKNKRDNGESWCMPIKLNLNTESYYSANKNNKDYQNIDDRRGALPGETHYVYRCIDGRVEVEGCSVLRETICDEVKDDKGLSHAGCRDNKWENCYKSGGREDQCYPRGDCTFNSGGRNECWPRFPPGFESWNEETKSVSEEQCSQCGSNGWRNRCDGNECRHLGDCTYKGDHWSWTNFGIGAGIGASIAAAGLIAYTAIFAVPTAISPAAGVPTLAPEVIVAQGTTAAAATAKAGFATTLGKNAILSATGTFVSRLASSAGQEIPQGKIIENANYGVYEQGSNLYFKDEKGNTVLKVNKNTKLKNEITIGETQSPPPPSLPSEPI